MTTSCMISVTLQEFNALYVYGMLKCSKSRFVTVIGDDLGRPMLTKSIKQEIIAKLPQFSIDDEHSVLLLLLNYELILRSSAHDESSERFFEMIMLRSECIENIYPLTDRGKRILSTRLEPLSVKISDPLIEQEVNSEIDEKIFQKSIEGGKRLLEASIAKPSFVANNDFVTIAHKALFTKPLRPSEPSHYSLTAQVFNYSRFTPISINPDASYLIDLGIILKDHCRDGGRSVALEALRDFVKTNSINKRSLPDLVSTPELKKIFNGLHDILGSNEIELAALLFVLKWKIEGQNENTDLYKVICKDVEDSRGKIERSIIEAAVWLCGFYFGFDAFAHDIYSANNRDYHFCTADRHCKPIELTDSLINTDSEEEIVAHENDHSTITEMPEEEPASAVVSAQINEQVKKIPTEPQIEPALEKIDSPISILQQKVVTDDNGQFGIALDDEHQQKLSKQVEGLRPVQIKKKKNNKQANQDHQ